MVDSEDNTIAEVKTQQPSLETKTITDSMQTSNNADPSQPSVSEIHQIDLKKKTKLQFKNYWIYCQNSSHSVSTCCVDSIYEKNALSKLKLQIFRLINILEFLILIQINAINLDNGVKAIVIIV